MEIIFISILGLVQGLTEFLPISSSGHLVILKKLFDIDVQSIVIEVILHLGTLTAVIVYFFKDIKKIIENFILGIISKFRNDIKFDKDYFNLAIFILIGSIPAGLIGIMFKDFLETFFGNDKFVYVFLNITGLILLSTYFKRKGNNLNSTKSLLIGCAQAIAILPGISRSGITIASAMWLGVDKEKAVRFSFILAVPAIFGAALLSLKDISGLSVNISYGLIIGFVLSFVSGYIAIKVLLNLVIKDKFFIFGIYCILLGLIGFLFL